MASQQYGPLFTPIWHGIVIVARRVTANLLGTWAVAARAANFQVSCFTISRISTHDPFTRTFASMCEVSRSCIPSGASQSGLPVLGWPGCAKSADSFDGSTWQLIDCLHALRYNRQPRRCQSTPAPGTAAFFVSSISLPWQDLWASRYWSAKPFCYIGRLRSTCHPRWGPQRDGND